jgi:hypothetical protein
VPELNAVGRVILTPLHRLLANVYRPGATGMSHVVYAPSSTGKTTACQAFLQKTLRDAGSPGLMITFTTTESYLCHMASTLETTEQNVLACLMNGIRTVAPPATVLILDEFNSCGVANSNIDLISVLMRYIYQRQAGIVLYVVTQNIDVANELCKLNAWEKIGPLNGLTNPSRDTLLRTYSAEQKQESLMRPTPWVADAATWTRHRLTVLIDLRFPGITFDKDAQGLIAWVVDGMTPTRALDWAIMLTYDALLLPVEDTLLE